MKFSQWFEEQDGVLPDAKQFSYIACVLDLLSQNHLEAVAKKWFMETFGHVVPPDWSWRAHHMTVRFRRGGLLTEDMEAYRAFFGEDVKLAVVSIAADDNCMAAIVKPGSQFPMQNSMPHITIAHSKSVSPDYSNTLLMDRSKMHQVSVTELNSVFAAVRKDQKNIWPEKSFPLAVPIKV